MHTAKALREVLSLRAMADVARLLGVIAVSSAVMLCPGVAGAVPAPSFSSDDEGFLNSAARCDANQTAIAIGRSPLSLVVICVDANGRYQYRGVRISDGVLLQAPAQTTGSGGYLAHSDDVTYAVSAKALAITAGDEVIRSEQMIDYRQPHLYPAEVGGARNH